MGPKWTTSGVLPPFLGAEPTRAAEMAPYPLKASEFCARFATSPERKEILRGWLRYRSDLRALGINSGFQWLDGSFVEDCETLRNRPPDDLDLVTFAPVPPGVKDAAALQQIISDNSKLFSPDDAKGEYHCHAFYVSFNLRPDLMVNLTRFYFGLFSHQRVTGIWKGMLQVALASDDAVAAALLA